MIKFYGNWDRYSGSKSFTCFNCNSYVASNNNIKDSNNLICICSHCHAPNIFVENKPLIAPLEGKIIKKLPPNIEEVYDEIRKTMQISAYTSCAMLMRKLLMHISVEEGADEGKTFQFYIEYMENNGIILKKTKPLVDKIRTTGNEATHKIANATEDEVKNLFKLVEIILQTTYEFNEDIIIP